MTREGERSGSASGSSKATWQATRETAAAGVPFLRARAYEEFSLNSSEPSMRILTAAALLLAASQILSGCQSAGDSAGDIGSSFEGGLGRDTYGTNRRVDVYGGTTSPTLPSIGAPGRGK